MEHLTELLHLLARWVHLIAGIMWIGNSMLFNWLDRNLELPDNAKPGLIGTMWMVHSGGFYEVEKKHLAPSQMPRLLHWFKWQNGITWLSGISLLILVYFLGNASLIIDPAVATLSPRAAIALSLSTLAGTYLAYDAIWRSRLGKNQTLGIVLSIAAVAVATSVFFRFMSGRAAFIHFGVLLGTLMTGNVWFVIIPSQRELVAATVEGREQDPKIGYQAKARSIHNNYMTFPLLFTMISNHFPSTFGHRWSWLVLVLLACSSAGIRHLMNIRFVYREWLLPTALLFFSSVVGLYVLLAHPNGLHPPTVSNAPAARTVTFAEANAIFQRRCVTCHAAQPTSEIYRVAPNGVMLDTPAQIARHVPNIRMRVVILRNMPLANLTHMEDAEREAIGMWIDQGAHTQ